MKDERIVKTMMSGIIEGDQLRAKTTKKMDWLRECGYKYIRGGPESG